MQYLILKDVIQPEEILFSILTDHFLVYLAYFGVKSDNLYIML